MRIVITRRSALDYRDGVNIFIFALADALIAIGHEVTVLATRVGDPERIAQLFDMRRMPELVEIHGGRTRLSYEGLTTGWLTHGARTIKRLQPDLVINNGALPFAVDGHSCNLAHDLGWATPRRFDRVRRLYKRYAYGRCDEIVALCDEVRNGLADELGTRPDRIRTIPPCVDLPAYQAARLERREDAILHTGTAGYKNPAETVRAFALLDRPSSRLYVEGAITADLSRQVSALPAARRARIDLLGELSAAHLRGLLGSVRVASFPSRYGVPTASATVVEAIASGTPIVGSPLLSRDVLRGDSGNGMTCRDEVDLRAAYGQLLTNDDEWSAMSNTALSMSTLFSADAVARSYLSLLEPRES